jgi:hypothetical protein
VLQRPQKQQHAGDKGGKSAIKKNVDDFVAHVMVALRANCVDGGSYYCDSGASRHITPNKQFFVSRKIIHSRNM